jgi:hypothetical protein
MCRNGTWITRFLFLFAVAVLTTKLVPALSLTDKVRPRTFDVSRRSPPPRARAKTLTGLVRFAVPIDGPEGHFLLGVYRPIRGGCRARRHLAHSLPWYALSLCQCQRAWVLWSFPPQSRGNFFLFGAQPLGTGALAATSRLAKQPHKHQGVASISACDWCRPVLVRGCAALCRPAAV